MNWILSAYLSCAAVIVGLLVILNNLGRERSWMVRILMYITILTFLFLGLAINREIPVFVEHADTIVFVGVSVSIVSVVLYIVLQQSHISVKRNSGGAALVSILLLIVGSCSHGVISDPVVTTPPGPNVVMLTITYNAEPASLTLTKEPLKYGKLCWWSSDVDDLKKGIMTFKAVFQGGSVTENNVNYTYPGKKSMTDGCGNVVTWRAGLALNARSGVNNGDLWGTSGLVGVSEVGQLIDADFGLMNHGYYHELDNVNNNINFVPDRGTTFSPAGWDLVEMEKTLATKLATIGKTYYIQSVVTPSNYETFTAAADSLGYQGITATAVRGGPTYAGYPTFPSYTRGGAVATNLNNMVLEESLPDNQTRYGNPNGYLQITRWNLENWVTDTLTYNKIKEQFKLMVDNSSMSAHRGIRFLTHAAQGPILPYFANLMDYFESVAGDKVWFVSYPEYLNYRNVRQKVTPVLSGTGTTRTITLDYSNTNKKNRYNDISLRLLGGTITNVKVSGMNATVTYNASTGLINVFNRMY